QFPKLALVVRSQLPHQCLKLQGGWHELPSLAHVVDVEHREDVLSFIRLLDHDGWNRFQPQVRGATPATLPIKDYVGLVCSLSRAFLVDGDRDKDAQLLNRLFEDPHRLLIEEPPRIVRVQRNVFGDDVLDLCSWHRGRRHHDHLPSPRAISAQPGSSHRLLSSRHALQLPPEAETSTIRRYN